MRILKISQQDDIESNDDGRKEEEDFWQDGGVAQDLEDGVVPAEGAAGGRRPRPDTKANQINVG